MFSTSHYIDVLRRPVGDRQEHLREIASTFEAEIVALDGNIAETGERIKDIELQLPSDGDSLLNKVIAGFRTCSDLSARLESMDLGLQRIEAAFGVCQWSDRDTFRRLSFEITFRLDAIRDLRERCQYMYSAIQVNEAEAARAARDVETSSWVSVHWGKPFELNKLIERHIGSSCNSPKSNQNNLGTPCF